MDVFDLVELYDRGVLTIHETTLRIALLVDPEEPSNVLSELPPEILLATRSFVDEYSPTMRVFPECEIPSQEQITAVTNWLQSAQAGG